MKALALAAAMAALVIGGAAATAAEVDPKNALDMELAGGHVIIKLLPDLAPNHVARMKMLVERKFYDGLTFHRVIPGFMAQTGDPTGTGSGGSSEPDLKAEFTDTPFVRGTIGAARTSDPDSANSQFFICLTDDGCAHLRGKYTVWGQVVQGMEAVDKIAPGEPPEQPDKIVSLKLMAPN